MSVSSLFFTMIKEICVLLLITVIPPLNFFLQPIAIFIIYKKVVKKKIQKSVKNKIETVYSSKIEYRSDPTANIKKETGKEQVYTHDIHKPVKGWSIYIS